MTRLRNLRLLFLGLMVLSSLSLARSEEPLPKVEDVIKLAVKRADSEAQNDKDFKLKYYFVRSKLTEIRNSDGELKKSDSRISTNFPPKVVAAPEPEPEPKPEVVVLRSPKDEDFSSSKAGKATARKFDKNQFQFNEELVARYDFKLISRETTNGYSLLVVDFAPKKQKLPESGIREKLMNRVAGRIWVDEREHAIKACKLHLLESVSILGGIVGEAQKFEYSFDRERTEDGIWYVADSKWRLEGRQVIVYRKAEYHETRTQVKKAE
jgi:hypothetical protein